MKKANKSTKGTVVTEDMILERPMPQHIAIIMDGNGRWAKRQGLPRIAGHRIGMESLKKVVQAFGDLKIGYLTIYAFSTENWKRPVDEVDGLMSLMIEFIDKELDYLDEQGVCIHPIGMIEGMKTELFEKISYAQERTKHNSKLVLNVALNYGGRQEICRGIKLICQEVVSGNIEVTDINEELIGRFLYTKDQPDPDLLIRPSGEFRVSNFLLWQIAYTEFWTTDVLWPDFKKEHLWQAIYDYQSRERRYGGLTK